MGGSGGELVNLPPYVGVEHRIILAANVQCHIRIPFILFSILLSLILWVSYGMCRRELGINFHISSQLAKNLNVNQTDDCGSIISIEHKA